MSKAVKYYYIGKGAMNVANTVAKSSASSSFESFVNLFFGEIIAELADLDRERLVTILETITSAVVLVESDGRFSYINRRGLELYGINYVDCDMEEHVAKVNAQNLDGAPYPLEDMPVSRSLKYGEAIRNRELIIRRADGLRIPVTMSSAPLYNAEGVITSAVVVFEDISERKRQENALSEHRNSLERLVADRTGELERSEQQYRTLVENLPVVISRYDRQLRYLYRSPQGDASTYDLDSTKMLGKTWEEYGIPEDVYRPWQQLLTNVLKTGQPVEYETSYPDRNGEVRNYLVRVVPATDETGQVESLLSVSLDITERKRNQELLDTVMMGMKDGFYVLDPELRFIYVNKGMGRVWGLSPEALVGKSIANVFPGIIEISLEKFRQALATQTPQDYEVMSRVVNRWYHMRVYPFREGIAVFCLDIDDHKRMGEALNHSEDRFGKIFNTSPVMTVIIRMADNKYVEVNQKFLDVVGYTRDEAIGRTPQELGLWAADAGQGSAILTKLREKGEYHNADIKLATKTGKIVTALTSAVLITFNGEQCRLATMQDITKEKQMEENLSRLERLNTVGEMAAAIGHEVRNPLTTVRGYLQMMQRRAEFAGHGEQLATMIEELDRANSIISDFLSLAKNRSVDLRPCNLNDVIGALLPLLQTEALRTGHELIIDTAEIPDSLIDDKEIRQLLLNLCNNAFQAMESGGRLTIATRAAGSEVILSIRDTGKGIPREILAKLGTPFITTKENGTGLGLAVCHRIAERHGAKIDIDTSPHGTTFSIRFPASG